MKTYLDHLREWIELNPIEDFRKHHPCSRTEYEKIAENSARQAIITHAENLTVVGDYPNAVKAILEWVKSQ